MKKIYRIAALVLALALLAGLAAGCGPKFDASGYVKCQLDAFYLNQHDNVEKYTNSTKEDSAQDYEDSMAEEGRDLAETLASQFELEPTQEQIDLATDFVKQSYSKVRYTVGKATADGKNFVVPVTYETLLLYTDANFEAVSNEESAWIETNSEALQNAFAAGDEAAITALADDYLKMYIGAWVNCLSNPEYDESETMELHVNLGSDDLYDIADDEYQSLYDNLLQ